MESLEELHHWVAEEAEYQVQASEIKHGLSSVGSVRGKSSTKSYFGTTEEKRDRPCKVCNQKHPIWKCDMFKGMEHRKKWETAKKLGLHYHCLRKGGHLVTHVLGAESVELTDARTNTIGYFTRRK